MIENNLLIIRESKIHAMGVFAKQKITSNTKIVEYVGRLISKEESKQLCSSGNNFIFELDGKTDIDGNVDWNIARFINHSCEPNCEAQIIDGHIWIVAIRDVEPGEELTFNYGYSIENYHDYPCKCRSNKCIGFMVAEELFPIVKEENKTTQKK